MKALLTFFVCICLAVPAAFAASAKLGECPEGYSCAGVSGDPAPDAVTGHTIYAKWVMEARDRQSLALPTDFAAIAGYFELRVEERSAVQRECVVWFDGKNLDQRAPGSSWRGGPFPSDEDERAPRDVAAQDYSFDRDVASCVPTVPAVARLETSRFAVAVEQGDCAPHEGRDFRFRGKLDFIDPHNIYHEVQEFDYVCGGRFARSVEVNGGGGGVPLPAEDPEGEAGSRAADAVKDLFPWTGTDRHGTAGCRVHETPAANADPVNGSAGHADLGHKCNGSLQELFTERLWMTALHARVWDETIQDHYNFALQVDTCAGVNVHEWPGKDAAGEQNGWRNASVWPPRRDETPPLDRAPDAPHLAQDLLYQGGLEGALPLVDRCTDGSSWSFDDTPRGRTVHSGPPGDGEEIMRGNAYDTNASSDTFATHRTNCRTAWMDWPMNHDRADPSRSDCYPEDHRTVAVDLYVYDKDPTGGLWAANANGLTGLHVYSGAGTPTGADGRPT